MDKLPKLLESFPTVVENQKQLTEQLFEQLKANETKQYQFMDAVEKIPTETFKQTNLVGTLGSYRMTDTLADGMEFSLSNTAIINFSGLKKEGATGVGHSYFREVPSVSSDLIIMLRDDVEAGSPQRPLVSLGMKFLINLYFLYLKEHTVLR